MYDPFIMQKKEEGGIPMAGRKPKPTAVKNLEDTFLYIKKQDTICISVLLFYSLFKDSYSLI